MKVLVIFLDYLRHDFTKQSLHSIANAGYPFDLITIDKFGIASATNDGFDFAKKNGYDAIVYGANDIQLPNDWLKHMVHYAERIPNTGMCGIHCVEGLADQIEMNGLMIHPTYTAFANVLIPMKVIEDIGYMNEDHDPYGMQDSDYALRLNNSGYINYYIPNLKQEHIGHDVGNGTEYRKMKDDGLSLAGPKWGYWTKYYEENGYKINDRQIFKTKKTI
jgi:glycosyltransferase involved in cell wall biosynthesis